MPETRKTFAFDVDEKITVKATGRAGWVAGLQVTRGDERLYSIETTTDEGRPTHLWARADEIEAVEPDGAAA